MSYRYVILLTALNILFGSTLADYCSSFNDCESCAGRHRVTFQVCLWCPSSDSCISPSYPCPSALREIFDCPRLLQVAYNETFTRNIATPLIAAAQGTHLQIKQCLSRVGNRLQLWKRFAIQLLQGGERCDGYLAIDYEHRAIIVSFSSVAGGNKLLYNRISMEFFTNRQAMFEGTDGLVNRYIYDSWFKIWYVLGMETSLKVLLGWYGDFDVWILGHAIGGAKAEMAAAALASKNWVASRQIRLMTFGSIRVGDNSFVEILETKVPYRFRIVHNRDMVVRYPQPFPGEWTPPQHHRYEVWYPNDMSPGSRHLLCLGAEDPQCSWRMAPWELRADDNDNYFQRNMETWAQSGCDPEKKVTSVIRFNRYSDLRAPTYNIQALRTARPFTPLPPPSTRLPPQSTPEITLPPRMQTTLHWKPTTTTAIPQTSLTNATPVKTTTTSPTTSQPTTTTPQSSQELQSIDVPDSLENKRVLASATPNFFRSPATFRSFLETATSIALAETTTSNDLQANLKIEPSDETTAPVNQGTTQSFNGETAQNIVKVFPRSSENEPHRKDKGISNHNVKQLAAPISGVSVFVTNGMSSSPTTTTALLKAAVTPPKRVVSKHPFPSTMTSPVTTPTSITSSHPKAVTSSDASTSIFITPSIQATTFSKRAIISSTAVAHITTIPNPAANQTETAISVQTTRNGNHLFAFSTKIPKLTTLEIRRAPQHRRTENRYQKHRRGQAQTAHRYPFRRHNKPHTPKTRGQSKHQASKKIF